MSGQQREWSCGLLLPLLVLSAAAVRADPSTSYIVSGSTGAALWGVGNQPGTEALIFAFNQAVSVQAAAAAAAAKESPPAPGPRVFFSVTQWALAGDGWVLRQWYGDVPMTPPALVITPDLMQGTLDVTVPGTLVESRASGTTVQRGIPGRLQVTWTGSGDLANSTTAYTYQTALYTTTLQSIGTGRLAAIAATITVPALGDPIPLWGAGSLGAVTTGSLNVTMQ